MLFIFFPFFFPMVYQKRRDLEYREKGRFHASGVRLGGMGGRGSITAGKTLGVEWGDRYGIG